VNGAGAKGYQKKSGKLAGNIPGEKVKIVAGVYIDSEIFMVPAIIHANYVMAGGDRESNFVTE
jgi:hypothetical protein